MLLLQNMEKKFETNMLMFRMRHRKFTPDELRLMRKFGDRK